MRKILFFTFVALIGLSSALFADTGRADRISLGIFPYLDPDTLLEKWGGLAKYLEIKLGRKVTILTAADYKIFVKRSYQNEYNFVITAAHMGRLAEKEAGFMPLVAPQADLYGIFVVRKGSNFHALKDLQGEDITTPSPVAIITMAGLSTLEKNGLVPGRNITTKTHPSHNSAIMSVHYGHSVAGLCSVKAFNIMKDSIKSDLEVIAATDKMPYPIIFMSGPKNSAELTRAFQKAVFAYFTDTDQGRNFMKQAEYSAMVEPQENELKKIDPYLNETKRQLTD